MTQQKKSPVKTFFKCVGIVLMIIVLYYTRSFWPLFFVGEPIATIQATIPPDKQLRIGMDFGSSSCKEITASDGSFINGGKGWSKLYSPDKNGKVKVDVYPDTISFCDWKVESFSIGIINNEIPAYVYNNTLVPNEGKRYLKEKPSKGSYGFIETLGDVRFKINSKYEKNSNQISVLAEKNIIPFVRMTRNKSDSYFYVFDYISRTILGESEYQINPEDKISISYIVREDPKRFTYYERDRIEKTSFQTTAENGRQEMPYP